MSLMWGKYSRSTLFSLDLSITNIQNDGLRVAVLTYFLACSSAYLQGQLASVALQPVFFAMLFHVTRRWPMAVPRGSKPLLEDNQDLLILFDGFSFQICSCYRPLASHSSASSGLKGFRWMQRGERRGGFPLTSSGSEKSGRSGTRMPTRAHTTMSTVHTPSTTTGQSAMSSAQLQQKKKEDFFLLKSDKLKILSEKLNMI